jgi:hypothetical protein
MNELYALHHNDQLVYDGTIYKNWHPWGRGRKVYPTRPRAEAALRQIPEEYRQEFSIVRYIPAEESDENRR